MEGAAQVFGGYSKSGEYAAQASIAEQQARDVDLQALQASGQRREQLAASLSAISAHRAASNLSNDSPTAIAIQKEVRRQGVRGEDIQRLGFLNQEGALKMQASADRSAGRRAILGGYLSGITSIGEEAAKAMGV